MDIDFVVWSFLIIFMLHNFEEIIMIERWFNESYPRIRERIPSFAKKELDKFGTMTSAQFSAAVCVIFIVASALILITITTKQYYLFIGLNIFFALNIFTHPVQSIFLRSYVPGVWTTLLIIIPYNILFFYQLHLKGILNAGTLLNALIVTILLIPVLLISHKIAEKWTLR